jgi:heptaprenylglyceryl phosphate synthase
MAQSISLWGATYSNVPAVLLPKNGGGTARFDDTSDASADATVINSGSSAYVNGVKVSGSQVIQVYRTGSTTPSSSLGNNGDLYLKV